MIKDIIDANKSIDSTDNELQQLKEIFPGAFHGEEIDLEYIKNQLTQTRATKEGYELNFLGKSYAKLLAALDTETVIVPDIEHNQLDENKNSDNLYLTADNLDALKHLLKSYWRKVKAIYIDPPYNTGTDGFVYNDTFGFSKETLVSKLGVNDEEADRIISLTTQGSSSHSAWLTFMYPRLYLAKQLLKEDGVIFISIDDNEQANLRLLCNDVFGETNFVGQFVVIRSEGGGLAKQMVIGHDYALVYAKNIDEFTPLGKPKDIRGKIVEKDGEQYWIETDWLRKEFGKYGTCPYEEIVRYLGNEKKIEIDAGLESGDFCLIDKGQFHIVGRYRKVADDTSKFYTILKHLNKKGNNDLDELGMDEYFSFPKPVDLIKELILGATIKGVKDDLILDFFSGSSTTAQAVMELNSEDQGNRKFIMVQLDEETPVDSKARKEGFISISEIGMERVKRAARKCSNLDLSKSTFDIFDTSTDFEKRVFHDNGFKHFTVKPIELNQISKLDEFNPDILLADQGILDEFGTATVLTTWMNLDGYGLSKECMTIQLGDYAAYQIEDTIYLLNPEISDNSVKALIEKFEDSSFNCRRVVIFGYSFSMTEIASIKNNLKQIEGIKHITLDIMVRY